MKNHAKSVKTIATLPFLFVVISGAACSQQENSKPEPQTNNENPYVANAIKKGAESAIPDEHRVVILGRLLNAENAALPEVHIMLMEASSLDGKNGSEIKTTFKTGPDGKLANPDATTDKDGRFVIVADRRFWAETGKFTLHGGFLPGTTQNAGYLSGSNGSPLLISVHEDARTFDVGDIRVKR